MVNTLAQPCADIIEETAQNKGIKAMQQASHIAQEEGIANMTLEEINAEIAAARQ